MRTQLLQLSERSTDFTITLDPPIKFDENKEYEASLVHLETYNSIPNITKENNVFKYSNDKGNTWKLIELPTDAYEYTDIVDEIHKEMIKNKDYDHEKDEYFINFDVCRLSSIIEIKNDNYIIDFNCENSIGTTLGFTNEILNYGSHKSPKIVDIMKINTISVNVDFISGAYLNKCPYPSIYSFYPKVGPGYKIIEKPNNLFYLPINAKTLHKIRLWLTDQNGKVIDLQGEVLTVAIYIKQIKSS